MAVPYINQWHSNHVLRPAVHMTDKAGAYLASLLPENNPDVRLKVLDNLDPDRFWAVYSRHNVDAKIEWALNYGGEKLDELTRLIESSGKGEPVSELDLLTDKAVKQIKGGGA